MNPAIGGSYIGSKLIIVEGLTGSGKSIMAHMIARQLTYNGIPAGWVHEGELRHPIFVDDESSVERFMVDIHERWGAYARQVASLDQVAVVEACFLNNTMETLMDSNVRRSEILQFADRLLALIEPLDPVLVYLAQPDVRQALERNFANRGPGFEEFVIDLVAGKPYAVSRGWTGYEGMVRYWQDFVALTDELYDRLDMSKIRIDNSAGDWAAYDRQVLDYLSIPLVPEPATSPAQSMSLAGVYKARESGQEFPVTYEGGELGVSLLSNAKSRLIPLGSNRFLAQGWHFELSFEGDGWGKAGLLRIGGKDVDYLRLVGTEADRISP